MQRRKSFVAVACLIVCCLVLSALPAGAAGTKHGPKPAHGPKAPQTGNGGDKETEFSIAAWLADKALGAAASHAFGFLFTQLGIDGTSPELKVLNELKQQLDLISGQIATVQSSLDALNTQVLKNGLDAQLVGLRGQINTAQDVYEHQFADVIDAAITLANRRKNGDTPARIQNAVDTLSTARSTFITRFDNANIGSTVKNIHDALVPGLATPVLALMGQLLLSQRRYLTTQTSRDIRTLFDGLRQGEALAAYMKMERYVPEHPDDADANWRNYELARTEFLTFSVQEFRYLPPVIPSDVVIDAGPVSTLRTSTSDVSMFLPASDLGELRARPGLATVNPIDTARDAVNAGIRADFADWRVASQQQLTGLLGGFVADKGTTPADYLSALNSASPVWQAIAKTPWQYAWSGDVVDQSVRCSGLVAGRTVFHTVTFPSNTAVSVGAATPAWSPRPKLDTERQSSSSDPAGVCRTYAESQFAGPNASGRLMAARSTGAMRMDYTAVGGNPNIVPTANLRGADLTAFNLQGADLSQVNLVGGTLERTILVGAKLIGADLTGANLTETDLTGADLTNATLTGVVSTGIRGVPAALPTGWRLARGVLVGPGADLRGRDLSGADLRGADLTGVISGGTDCAGCQLPPGSVWSGASGGYLAAPHAVLPGADLAGTDLTGANLVGANLSGANLSRARLAGVDLTGANLTDANLTGSTLSGAHLTDAAMTHANLTDARVVATSLAGATLDTATLTRADLTGSTFTGASMTGVDLTAAQLGGADLAGVHLPGAKLPGANVTGADLRAADLSNSNLRGTGLTSSRLDRANLTGADLTGAVGQFVQLPAANLTRVVAIGADLYGADLAGAILRSASVSAADLTTADLTGADLTTANTFQADLSGATLTRAIVTGTIFSSTKLDGITSGGIAGTPAVLPGAWRLVNGFLLGRGANARGVNATGANLTGVDLTGADLSNANLTNANFTSATLVNVILTGATVAGANFATDNDNKLAGVVSGGLVGTPRALSATGRFRVVQGYLVGPNVNLSGATFTSTAQLGVSLSATNFTGATLNGVNLTGATLRNAVFANARLTSVDLTNADLGAANLKGLATNATIGTPALPSGYRVVSGYIVGPEVNLTRAALGSSQGLVGMNLTRADLTDANLRSTNLTSVNLTGADLTGALLENAVWRDTTCPNGVVQSTPCAPLPLTSQPTVTAVATANGNSFTVDVEPNLSSGDWQFTIERLTESNGWMPVGSYTTRGPDETASVNLPAGTYRVVVPRQGTAREATSAPVVLTR